MPLGFRNGETKGRLLLNLDASSSITWKTEALSDAQRPVGCTQFLPSPLPTPPLYLLSDPGSGTIYKLKLWFEWILIWFLESDLSSLPNLAPFSLLHLLLILSAFFLLDFPKQNFPQLSLWSGNLSQIFLKLPH